MKKRKRNRIKKLLFAALAVALFFAAAETACRIFRSDLTREQPFWKFGNPHLSQSMIYDHDPVLFWKLKPDNEGYEVNSLGYRGKAVGPKKGPNEIRIICLGDSCTFGLGPVHIPAGVTYSALLQKRLQEALPDKTISVLNFGCPGYTSFQGKLLLKRKAVDFNPDVVTAYFGINDVLPAMGFTDAQQRPMTEPPDIGVNPRRCCTYEALVRLVYGFRLSATPCAEGVERVPPADYHENMRQMSAVGRNHGFAVYFMDPPYLETDNKVTRLPHLVHQPQIDICGALQKAQTEGIEPIFGMPDFVHPNLKGHKIIAEFMANFLLKERPWEK